MDDLPVVVVPEPGICYCGSIAMFSDGLCDECHGNVMDDYYDEYPEEIPQHTNCSCHTDFGVCEHCPICIS